MVSRDDYENYKSYPLTSSLIDRNLSNNFCPIEAIPQSGTNNHLTASLKLPFNSDYTFSSISFEKIPRCDTSFVKTGIDICGNGNESGGCCITSKTCDGAFSDSSGFNEHGTGILFSIAQNILSNNKNIDLCENYVDTNNNPGYTFLTMDENNVLKYSNPIGKGSDISNAFLNVCHKEDIRTPYLEKLLNKKDGIQDFFITFGLIALILFCTTFIGACYEFWLIYGTAKNCIYFKSKCSNMGPPGNDNKTNETTLIDYMFPSHLSYYPYQHCKTKQTGGNKGEIVSNYIENLGTCVDINIEPSGKDINSKPFPYNIPDWAESEISSEFLRNPFKIFTFFFLFTVLTCRYWLNIGFNKLSKKYRQHIKDNVIGSGIVFLLLTGLFPLILNAFLGGSDGRSVGSGPFLPILTLISSIIPFFALLGGIITFFRTNIFPNILKKYWEDIENDHPDISKEYYHLGMNFPIRSNFGRFWKMFSHMFFIFGTGDASDMATTKYYQGAKKRAYQAFGGFHKLLKKYQEKAKSSQENDKKIFSFFYRYIYLYCIRFIIELLVKTIYDLIILLLIPLCGLIFLIVFGIFGWLAAYLYLGFSIPFNIFAIPIKNPIELFNIFKKHSDVITILFCIAVIASFKSSIPTSVGADATFNIMSIGVVIIILFKLYNSLRKSV